MHKTQLCAKRNRRILWRLTSNNISCNHDVVSTHCVEALTEFVPTVDDLDPCDPLIIDGTLVPCWDRVAEDGLYSVKHQSVGLIQVACNLSGRLAWLSDPTAGSTRDSKALGASGFLNIFPAESIMGDKGYIGKGMITPEKKRPGRHPMSKRTTTKASIPFCCKWKELSLTSRRGESSTQPTVDR